MMRTAIWMIVFLLGISGGAVYMQWRSYEYKSEQSSDGPLMHMIEMRRVGNDLEVKQTVKGIDANRSYEILVPSAAKQVTYADGAKRQALSYKETGKSVVQAKRENGLSFQYTIPLPRTNTIWLERWSIAFLTKQPQRFHVQLVDYATKNGMWAAGAPLEGRLQKEAFTVYSWSQENLLSFPLYFQLENLPRQTAGHIELYSRNKEAMKAFAGTDVPSLTVVRSMRNETYVSPTLVVAPEKSAFSSLRSAYMRAYYASLFLPSGAMNKWVGDLLAALALQQQPVTPEAKAAWQQLQRNLTEEERKAFFSSLLEQKGEALSASMLDAALSATRTGSTTYFAGLATRGAAHSLVFTNDGELYVNEKRLHGAKAILRNGEILLPFSQVMGQLGYRVTTSGAAVFIEKDRNRWRFFVNSPVYMRGNDRFGAPSIIIHDINGALYMSTDMFQRWFSVQIWTNERDIYVKSTE